MRYKNFTNRGMRKILFIEFSHKLQIDKLKFEDIRQV